MASRIVLIYCFAASIILLVTFGVLAYRADCGADPSASLIGAAGKYYSTAMAVGAGMSLGGAFFSRGLLVYNRERDARKKILTEWKERREAQRAESLAPLHETIREIESRTTDDAE